MTASRNIEDEYVANPHWPFSYFPYGKNEKTVSVATLYTTVYKDNVRDYHNPHTELGAAEIEAIRLEILDSLKPTHLDWGYIAGRARLIIGLDDLPRVYEILEAFLNKGLSVLIYDATQTTVHPEDRPLNALKHQACFLRAQKEHAIMTEWSHDRIRWVLNVAFWRDAFWNIPEGKEWARAYRERNNITDKRGGDRDPEDKSFTISEYFGEIVTARKKAETASENLCVICETRPVTTLVLPCMHATVCSVCAEELKKGEAGTHAAKHCVYCNQEIQSVLSEDAE